MTPNRLAALMCLLCVGLVGCSTFAQIGLRRPDEALLERAMNAVQEKHFDVAHITLQTLVNSYQDSMYAAKAQSALQDPRITDCGDAWIGFPKCEIVFEPERPD